MPFSKFLVGQGSDPQLPVGRVMGLYFLNFFMNEVRTVHKLIFVFLFSEGISQVEKAKFGEYCQVCIILITLTLNMKVTTAADKVLSFFLFFVFFRVNKT